jgi:hypothetical protein
MTGEFLSNQNEQEGRLTFALYSALRAETETEREQWCVISEVLALTCSPIDVEMAKTSALGMWIEELGVDPDLIPETPYE